MQTEENRSGAGQIHLPLRPEHSGLRQCIRALCEAAAWIADLSPLQAACVALLRTRGTPFAPLCGYPHDVATSLSPCWSCEAWSRTDRCVRLDAKRPVRGLGEPQQAASEYRKRYSDALLATFLVIGMKADTNLLTLFLFA